MVTIFTVSLFKTRLLAGRFFDCFPLTKIVGRTTNRRNYFITIPTFTSIGKASIFRATRRCHSYIVNMAMLLCDSYRIACCELVERNRNGLFAFTVGVKSCDIEVCTNCVCSTALKGNRNIQSGNIQFFTVLVVCFRIRYNACSSMRFLQFKLRNCTGT